MVLKIRYLNLFKPIFRLVIIVISILTFGFIYAGGFDSTLLPGLIIILCIPVLPTTYLFIEYYLVTKRQTVTIDDSSITIKYDNENAINKYLFTDLRIVKLYKSKGMEKGNFPFQTAEMFYHAKIITNDDKEIILTSLLAPDFDVALKMLNHVKIDVIRTVYSTIYI